MTSHLDIMFDPQTVLNTLRMIEKSVQVVLFFLECLRKCSALFGNFPKGFEKSSCGLWTNFGNLQKMVITFQNIVISVFMSILKLSLLVDMEYLFLCSTVYLSRDISIFTHAYIFLTLNWCPPPPRTWTGIKDAPWSPRFSRVFFSLCLCERIKTKFERQPTNSHLSTTTTGRSNAFRMLKWPL